MKWFGVLLILSAACLAGLYQKEKFAHRVRDLKQIQAVFTALRAGVAYRFESLPNLLDSVPQNPFAAAWKEAVQQEQEIGNACRRAADRLTLQPDDLRLIDRFAADAGKLGHQEQLTAIDLFLRQLEENLNQARQEAQNRGRVQLALSVCLGGVVSLLLI